MDMRQQHHHHHLYNRRTKLVTIELLDHRTILPTSLTISSFPRNILLISIRISSRSHSISSSYSHISISSCSRSISSSSSHNSRSRTILD